MAPPINSLLCMAAALSVALVVTPGLAFAPTSSIATTSSSTLRSPSADNSAIIHDALQTRIIAHKKDSVVAATRMRRLQKQSRIPLAMVGQVFDSNILQEPSTTTTTTTTTTSSNSNNNKNQVVVSPEPSLSPLEVWCLVRIEQWYQQALSHKCPFLRRRMTDFMDTLEMLVRVVVVRQQNIDLVGPPVGCRGDEKTRYKTKGLSLEELAAVIRKDWKEETKKGYYITGRLTPSIYRDDCFFDGPDPDMPVRGLRKFLNAASQLFDPKQSRCDLLSLKIDGDVVVARWRMNGVLRLPWRPKLPEVQGTTIYHFDEEGLVYRHEETWDLSAVEAFLKTAWFDFQSKAANSYNEKLQI